MIKSRGGKVNQHRLLQNRHKELTKKLANLEAPPDPQVVVHVNLSDRLPLKVRTNCIHLALVDAYTSIHLKGLLCVVESG